MVVILNRFLPEYIDLHNHSFHLFQVFDTSETYFFRWFPRTFYFSVIMPQEYSVNKESLTYYRKTFNNFTMLAKIIFQISEYLIFTRKLKAWSTNNWLQKVFTSYLHISLIIKPLLYANICILDKLLKRPIICLQHFDVYCFFRLAAQGICLMLE